MMQIKTTSKPYFPQGTLIFTDQGGLVVNRVLKLKWTHALIYLGGDIWEATWPRVKRSTTYKHVRCTMVAPLLALDWEAMKALAEENEGRRYSATGYFRPELYNKTPGIYCSQFVAMLLEAGGSKITVEDGRDPDILYTAITGRKP